MADEEEAQRGKGVRRVKEDTATQLFKAMGMPSRSQQRGDNTSQPYERLLSMIDEDIVVSLLIFVKSCPAESRASGYKKLRELLIAQDAASGPVRALKGSRAALDVYHSSLHHALESGNYAEFVAAANHIVREGPGPSAVIWQEAIVALALFHASTGVDSLPDLWHLLKIIHREEGCYAVPSTRGPPAATDGGGLFERVLACATAIHSNGYTTFPRLSKEMELPASLQRYILAGMQSRTTQGGGVASVAYRDPPAHYLAVLFRTDA